MTARYRYLAMFATLSLGLLVALPTAAIAAQATPATGTLYITGQRSYTVKGGKFLSFSPDGSWAAVRMGSELCIAAVRDPQSYHCVQFSKNGPLGVDEPNVRWSPDGSKLAFSEDAYRLLVNSDIWVMDAATGKVTNLTPDAYKGSLSKLIFGHGTPTPGVTVNVDTNPAWSADGKTIYFMRSPASQGFQGSHMMRIPAAGGTAAQIAVIDSKEPGVSYIGGLYPAPDGKTIFFTIAHQEVKDRRNGVWRIDVDGTGLRQLAGTQSQDLGYPILIALSPTGNAGLVQYVTAMNYAFSGPSFALMNMQSGTLGLLAAHTGAGTPPPHSFVTTAAFSPDGTRLVYGWATGNSRVQQLIVRILPGGAEHVLSASGINPLPVNPWTNGLVWASNNTILGTSQPNTGFVLNVAS